MGTHSIQTSSGGTNGVYHGREKKIAAQFAPRYRKAGKHEKSRILDEYLALSGSTSRKYAFFKLNRIGKTSLRLLDGQTVKVTTLEKNRKKRIYHPYYDVEVAAIRTVREKLQPALRKIVRSLPLAEP